MHSLRTIAALLRSSFLVAMSYRLQMLFSIGGLLVSVVPLYFVARALQERMGGVIAGEGSQYFAFVLLGTIAFLFVSEAMGVVPGIVSGSIGSGWFDAILIAPTPLPVTLVGLASYSMLFALLRAIVLLIAGALLGAEIVWVHTPIALLLLLLIVVAYSGLGTLSGALVVAFRTSGPLASGVLLLSGLLGGVYYPTTVLPGWIRELAAFVPLAPGLRALRRVLLDGAGLADVMPDVLALLGAAFILTVGGAIAMRFALRYARRAGTLSTY